MPLDTRFVVIRGGISFTPIRRFQMMAGTAVWRAVRDGPGGTVTAIELHYTTSQMAHVNLDETVDGRPAPDPDATPTALFVSPADERPAGETSYAVSAVDGRTDEFLEARPSILGNILFLGTARSHFEDAADLPEDFRRWWRTSEEALCPKSKRDALRSTLLEAVTPETYAMLASDNAHDKLKAKGKQYTAAKDSIDCASNYLKSDLPNTHGMGILELVAWTHYIVETPPAFVSKATTFRAWNCKPLQGLAVDATGATVCAE
jgi:hypothetical protein